MATANMGLTLPTIDGSTGVWDTLLNAALELVDAHDHTSGKGPRIPVGGLNIAADLTFAGNAATNLKAAAFTAQASYTTARSLWVRSSDNELIFRTSGGTDIQITSGTSLNLSLVGGIAGDYAAAAASLYYDDAAEAYRFLEAAPSPNDWSYVKAGGVDIYEHASGIANYVALRSPAALAATYTLTFPAAVPGSTQLVQVSSAGAMTFSNSGLNSLTLAADAHVTVSGTGRFKHGDLIRNFSVINGDVTSGTFGFTVGGRISGGAATLAVGLDGWNSGERIKSFSVALFGNATVDGSVDVIHQAADGTNTTIGTATLTNVPAAWANTTINITDTTIADGDVVYAVITAAAANLQVGGIQITYDRP